ncbi:curli-like amyloid fiber formation chaperone CsgH [Rubricoccus marinus]|uniref:curli-like amyloid fiber formation chaperone CsgH n=1 Tax=Rubricoccus marinus TaxID=716817 RepID=UPI001179B27D|nr:curli-like amyloid fiber formation chaperone CsgH [Rubricoccus marinus]
MLAFVACASTASTPEGAVALGVTETGSGYAFHVLARGPAQGAYTLTALKSGASGTSRSVQSGRFDLTGGTTDTLSVSRTNTASGDHVTAELVVTWASGQTTTESFERMVR